MANILDRLPQNVPGRFYVDHSSVARPASPIKIVAMSTLVQIESAVAELPPQEQWSLLSWLQARLRSEPKVEQPSATQHPAWLEEVRQLREQCATGKPGTLVEQLVSEIRS